MGSRVFDNVIAISIEPAGEFYASSPTHLGASAQNVNVEAPERL